MDLTRETAQGEYRRVSADMGLLKRTFSTDSPEGDRLTRCQSTVTHGMGSPDEGFTRCKTIPEDGRGSSDKVLACLSSTADELM